MKYEYKDGVSVEDCPFCASSWGPPQPEQHAASGRWSVGCMNAHCGANSGWCDTEAEAIALWNKRPNAAMSGEPKASPLDGTVMQED